MNIRYFLVIFAISLVLTGCSKREQKNPGEPPEGAVNASALETRHDYYLPFAIVNDNSDISMALLNDSIVNFAYGDFIEFRENGFYTLVLKYNSQQANDTFLFTTTTEERANSEWGIRSWVPAHYSTTSLGTEETEICYPHRYTDQIKVPFIFYVREGGNIKPVYCSAKCVNSDQAFSIKRGVGSVNVPSTALSDQVYFTAGGKQLNVPVSRILSSPVELQVIIDTNVEIPVNGFARITADLEISSTGSLTVNEGAVILIDEAVDVSVSGPVIFSGTMENPVFVTCSNKDKFWGGFITRREEGTINARYTIFCQSGYHDSDEYGWGHAGRQALFYTENSSLVLDHCFIIDHIGQAFYPTHSVLDFSNILVQRVKTGGQLNYSELTLKNSVFTDFPEESDDFADLDNDALYLNATNAVIDNTTFMFAKDDGLDSGADGGGTVTVTNCRFEACFHEGAALSSSGSVVKQHTFTGCVFTNCGQGLELGYSSPNHTVVADNCRFLDNGIGIRYGDNYDWSEVDGKMHIMNSVSLYNDKDIWNMVRKTWSPELENLTFENTMVSKRCPQYPEIQVSGQ